MFGNAVTQTDGALTSTTYQTTISGIDQESRAEPGEGMLDIGFLSDHTMLFETGMYYWPAGDLTVDVHTTQGYVGTWDMNGFTTEWRLVIYSGDVIAAVFDPVTGELEDVIDTLDDPICDMIIELTGAAAAPLATTTVDMLAYMGDFDDGLIEITVDPWSSARVVFRNARGQTEVLGRFAVDEDSTFAGPIPGGAIQGVVSSEGVTGFVRGLSKDVRGPLSFDVPRWR